MLGASRLETLDDLLGHPVVGSSWEGYAIESLLAAAPGADVSFYRTAAGAELDLVLELGGSRGSWAVEIKRGLDPRVSKGLRNAFADLRPTRTFVVYPGTDRYPLTPEVEAIGLRELAALLYIRPLSAAKKSCVLNRPDGLRFIDGT